jgi:hypothetical protein
MNVSFTSCGEIVVDKKKYDALVAALRYAASALAATGCKTEGTKEAYRKVAAALKAEGEL